MRGRDNNLKIVNNNANLNDKNDNKSQKENKELKLKIERIYQTEFEDGITSILTESESIFINKYLSKIRLVQSEIIQKLLLEDKSIKDFLKVQEEKIMDKYFTTKKYLLKIHNEFKKNFKFIDFLTKFRKHCKNCSSSPIHNCGNKLIIVREINEIKYVFCSSCKEVYLGKSLILFCKHCQVDYFSSVVNTNEEMDYQPATWENYHCGSLMNEQMLCIKCKDFMFIRLSDNNLYCRTCKFVSDPLKIVWICAFCKKEFQSRAEIYNSMKFKIIKNTIKEALLNKVLALPTYTKCCVNDKTITFKHKLTCKGDLYLCELYKKPILVCSKCKSIISIVGFLWTCPLCSNLFLDEDKKIVKSQVSTTETNKNNESSNSSNKMSKSNTLSNFDEDKDSKQPYIKKNINANINQKRESNFEKIGNQGDDKFKRNNSVYKYSNTNFKNNLIENNKKSSLIEIEEEDNNDVIIDKTNLNRTTNIHTEDDNKANKVEKIFSESLTNFKSSKFIESINSISKENSNLKVINNDKFKFNLFLNKTPEATRKFANINIAVENNCNSSRLHNGIDITGAHSNRSNNNSDSNLTNNVVSSNMLIYSPIQKIDLVSENKRSPVAIYEKVKTPRSSTINIEFNSSKILNPNVIEIQSNHKNINPFELNEKENFDNFNIDDFKILQSIGEGSFGVIYSCQNIHSKDIFALKKIIVNTEKEMELFISEYELVRKINHKNILTIYGMSNKTLDFSTRVLYILMELSQTDWDKEIRSRNKINNLYKEVELISLLKQIVSSLSFLQENGISHRDIKPQNILVFPDQIYKVGDFGEAKEVKIAKKQMATLRGTELYMSPVLFSTLKSSEKNNVEHNIYKSDVFSLGYCILYAATLSFKILYDLRNVNNQKNVVNIIKNYLLKKYSNRFIELIARMIDVSEVIRFDFFELNNYLNLNF